MLVTMNFNNRNVLYCYCILKNVAEKTNKNLHEMLVIAIILQNGEAYWQIDKKKLTIIVVTRSVLLLSNSMYVSLGSVTVKLVPFCKLQFPT